MEETKMQSGSSSALDEMHEVLAKREEIFTQREAQIENRMKELKAYELRVMEAAKKLKADNEQFKKLVEQKNLEFIEKQNAIDKEWEKIHAYEENCKRSMERVIEEQVKLQEKDNAQLEAAFKTEQESIADTSSALDELMASLDTSDIVPNFGTPLADVELTESVVADVPTEITAETPEVVIDASVVSTEDDLSSSVCEVPETEDVPKFGTQESDAAVGKKEYPDDIPEILKSFDIAAKKVFPKGFVQEVTSERICMAVGTRKIRVFAKGYSKADLPYVCVLEQKKDTKKLQQEIVQNNRVQSEWEFDYRENHFTSSMPFTEKTSAEVVLSLCKKVMDEYF